MKKYFMIMLPITGISLVAMLLLIGLLLELL